MISDWAANWNPSGASPPELLLTRGAGGHVDLLARRFPEAVVLSWAPRGAARQQWLGPLIEPETALFASAAQRGLALGVRVNLANPPQALCTQSPTEADLAEAVSILARRAGIEQGTLRAAARHCFPNLLENLPAIFGEGIPFGAAMQSLEGCPILVVGAGPSLSSVLEGIAEARQRLVVLAASSALRPLLAADIEPDLVAILETRDRKRHFEGVPAGVLNKIVLLADSSTFPAHLELPFAHKVIFHGAPGRWLAPIFGDSSLVPNGGNIGTAMLVMAWMLGARPVLSAGLDYAAPAGQHYVRGSGSEGLERQNVPKVIVQGWDGSQLEAGLDLACYREETETLISGIHQIDGEARFEAVSLGGARIAGMIPTGWEKAQAALPVALAPLKPELAARLKKVAAVRSKLYLEPSPVEPAAGLLETVGRIAADPAGPLRGYLATDPGDPLLNLLLGPGLLDARESPKGFIPAAQEALESARSMVEALGRRAEEVQHR